jgi:hypothetical protein
MNTKYNVLTIVRAGINHSKNDYGTFSTKMNHPLSKLNRTSCSEHKMPEGIHSIISFSSLSYILYSYIISFILANDNNK